MSEEIAPIRIMIISDAWKPQVNGVVRTYEYLHEELEKRGHTVKIIGPSDFPCTIPTPGYPEIKLAIMPYKHLTGIIEDFKPDRIHIATEGPLGWVARKYCRKHNRDFSTSFHTMFPEYVAKRVGKYLPFLYNATHHIAKSCVKRFHQKSIVMMIATQSLEDTLRIWGFTAPIFRLTRGVKNDIFKLGEKTKFQDFKHPVALYVGRVAIEKNIDAFLDMQWNGEKVVIGDGPSLTELKEKYPDAHFLGKKSGEDLAAYYRSADIFVFPSKTDTFGMVIIEALACGLPVAAYNVMGPKDIITEDYLGILDENLSLAAQQALKKGTAEQRANHVLNNYTWQKAAEQFETALISKVK
ncbi:MAG: glycosyltransferase family 4 protein [Bdellovibrionales bacterium]